MVVLFSSLIHSMALLDKHATKSKLYVDFGKVIV